MKSAKECVTTHLPNGLDPKMDGAAAGDRYSVASVRRTLLACRGVNVLQRRCGVGQTVAARCTDLGGSSNYSNASFED